jgi:hypothetical protein
MLGRMMKKGRCALVQIRIALEETITTVFEAKTCPHHFGTIPDASVNPVINPRRLIARTTVDPVAVVHLS